MSINNEFSVQPAGQPDGYDYYIPFSHEESRLLEKADYKTRMAVMNVATVIANSVDFSSAIFEKFYNRLVKLEREYEELKSKVSSEIVLPFIDSIYGDNSNVSVNWVHTFKTPFIAVKYVYNIEDHSAEKDLFVGNYPAADIGINDSTINDLENLSTLTQADKDVFAFIVRNYPDPDERQQAKIDEFIDAKDERTFAYEELKNTVTNLVNEFLAANEIGNANESLQWNLDFKTKVVSITRTTL